MVDGEWLMVSELVVSWVERRPPSAIHQPLTTNH